MPPLFSISNDRLHLSWDGPPTPPDASAPNGLLRVQPLRPGSSISVQIGGETAAAEAPLQLAEQTIYRVFLRSKTGVPVMLRHDDPLALRGLAPHDAGAVQSGVVDFEGQVGRSRFVVLVGGEAEVAFELDVFPAKASFAEVEAMREELDEALAGLAFEYLRATTSPTIPSAKPSHRATWLTLLLRVLPDLESALRHVAARPTRDLDRSRHFVRAEHVRRPDATVRRAVLQGGGSGERASLGPNQVVPAVLPMRRAFDTLDTPEHRWIRQRLEVAHATLSAIQQDEARLPRSARRKKVLSALADAERRVARLVQAEPLRTASSSKFAPVPTQRLTMAPGYAEAHEALHRLTMGVALAEGPTPHATRDLHALYEMWCYMAVLREVGGLLGQRISAADFFRSEHRGIQLVLRRGHRHAVSFDAGAQSVRVAYNPSFAAGRGLLAQRPDILLEIVGSTIRRFVLDAKYRRDDSAGYQRRFGAPGPPEDALGDLHRYRDAIRDRRGERIIEQAVALYPYRAGEGFDESRLWSAIGRVGVGAIPLVPGAMGLLTRWLERVLTG